MANGADTVLITEVKAEALARAREIGGKVRVQTITPEVKR